MMIFLTFLIPISSCTKVNLDEYMQTRTQILQEEIELSLGWNEELSVEEKMFNQLLMEEKDTEMAASFVSANFPPSISFLEAREQYEKSVVFQRLKQMPKGGLLHIHDISMTSVDWLITNATYRSHLHLKQVDGKVNFKFMEKPDEGWENVEHLRRQNGAEKFDLWLKQQLTMAPSQQRNENINDIWQRFIGCMGAASGIITYKPVFIDYFYQALTEFLHDGVQYVEFRTTLPPVYTLDGNSSDPLEVAALYKQIAEQFAEANPSWCGTKLIFAPIRHVPESTVKDDLVIARKLSKTMPSFFAGFDLVAQEDLGQPLIKFIEPLLEASSEMQFFFHAGETNWDWSSTDLNLADAVLLNTSRIGHGYAIDKHPKLMEMAKQKDISIEINPISNQVLGLVGDLRNHPAASLVKTSFPVVVSSDDPAVWGALPNSHDMYAAFMAIGGDSADLRFLKRLINNSLLYSAMQPDEKVSCRAKLSTAWQEYITAALFRPIPAIQIL